MDPGSTIMGVAVMAGLAGTTSIVIKGIIQYAKVRADGRHGSAELAGEVSALREEVAALRAELIETHERLDFTERLLTQARGEPREIG